MIESISFGVGREKHRVNGAAVKWENGNEEWYNRGVRHRYYGVACSRRERRYFIFGERII